MLRCATPTIMTKKSKNKRMENKYWVVRDLSGALFLTDNKPKRCTYEYGQILGGLR